MIMWYKRRHYLYVGDESLWERLPGLINTFCIVCYFDKKNVNASMFWSSWNCCYNDNHRLGNKSFVIRTKYSFIYWFIFSRLNIVLIEALKTLVYLLTALITFCQPHLGGKCTYAFRPFSFFIVFFQNDAVTFFILYYIDDRIAW